MNEKLNQIMEKGKLLQSKLSKKIEENWRLLLVGVIVLAIALNSLWEGNKSSSEKTNDSSAVQQTEQAGQSEQKTDTQQNNENSATNTAQAKESEVLGDSAIRETAEKSEGVTHLARRAVKKYLETNGETLSAEQKIYAEDYLKRQIGSEPLKIGQAIEFKTDLIKTGVEQAKALNQKQIENLSKYVPLTKNL